MALFSVPTGKVTLSSASTKSLILLAPTPKCTLRKITISLDGSAAAAAVEFDLYRVVTLGSPTGTSTTPLLADPSTQAAGSSALTALTAEPTTVSVLDAEYVQPLGGLLADWQPFGAEVIAAASGSRVGLRYVTASGVTPDCLATFWFEE